MELRALRPAPGPRAGVGPTSSLLDSDALNRIRTTPDSAGRGENGPVVKHLRLHRPVPK